jgi:membrane protease YdiL (CAAX protease family)
MNFLSTKPSILLEAEKAKFKPHFLLQILLFVLVFYIAELPAGIISAAYIVNLAFSNSSLDSIDKMQDYLNQIQTHMPQGLMLISLFCTAIATVLVIVYCRFIEKRSLHSMGLIKKNAFRDYIKGLLIGFILFSFSVLIALLSGTVEFNGLNSSIPFGIIFLFLLGFLIQGMNEEVMLRGYFMVSLANKGPIIAAILVNSIVFACLHLTNPGVSFLAIFNIILFGIFASIFALKSDSLWGICAIHSAWNFVQGNFYGFQVSGLETNTSIFSFAATKSGELINGGSFGMEGGLAVTFTLLIGIVVLLFIKGKNNSEIAH